jgi:hypothetical protein
MLRAREALNKARENVAKPVRHLSVKVRGEGLSKARETVSKPMRSLSVSFRSKSSRSHALSLKAAQRWKGKRILIFERHQVTIGGI